MVFLWIHIRIPPDLHLNARVFQIGKSTGYTPLIYVAVLHAVVPWNDDDEKEEKTKKKDKTKTKDKDKEKEEEDKDD